jgi:hypothetical protein
MRKRRSRCSTGFCASSPANHQLILHLTVADGHTCLSLGERQVIVIFTDPALILDSVWNADVAGESAPVPPGSTFRIESAMPSKADQPCYPFEPPFGMML